MLERYDGGAAEAHHGALRVAAAAAILRESPHIELPPWLLAMLGSPPDAPVAAASSDSALVRGSFAGSPADPAALLRLYILHGRLEDGVSLLVEHLQAWASNNPLVRAKSGALWLPQLAIRQLHASLHAALQQAQKQAGAKELAARLGGALRRMEEALEVHKRLMDTDRRDQLRPW